MWSHLQHQKKTIKDTEFKLEMLVDFSITREIEGDDLESVIEGELRLQVQRVPRRLIETTGEGPIRRITVREELGGNKDVAVDPFITNGY